MNSIGILWAQYGPYHFARVAACKKLFGAEKFHALELADRTSDYAWNRLAKEIDLITLHSGAVVERLSFSEVFQHARRAFAELRLEVCLLPSYAPKQSLAALLAARSLGIRTVMMNESHAGTARAKGIAAMVKSRLVRLFDAAIVGGKPQRRYFTSLGLPPEKMFSGYDAVDNDYFAARATEIRSRATEIRKQYQLPEHYFLSLGRFVAKKNLPTLIRAFREVRNANPGSRTHLVMVGSGEEESNLRKLCVELKLPVYEKSESAGQKTDGSEPGVHFYGFRQIDENSVFYALADAFILPSLWEEWGLVVNEAMACGLPVVVSETAGCAEDLLRIGKIIAPIHISSDLHYRFIRLAGRIRMNGFVFDPRSVESLANALILLQSLPSIRESMGRSGRIVVEDFSCGNFARNTLLAAHAALGSKPGAALPVAEPLGFASTRTR